MKFLSVRELKSKSAQVWRDLPTQKEMIVTSNGRPIAMLSAINEKNLEKMLKSFRIARATNAVASLQYASTENGTDQMSMEEIDAEIQIVRDERK